MNNIFKPSKAQTPVAHIPASIKSMCIEMEGYIAGLLYSVLLSTAYRAIFNIVRGKLSSCRGFIVTYLLATNIPIYIGLTMIHPILTLAMISSQIPIARRAIGRQCQGDNIAPTSSRAFDTLMLSSLIVSIALIISRFSVFWMLPIVVSCSWFLSFALHPLSVLG